MSKEKIKKLAGADEKTPSRAEYFSWINNTNEGSTEKQTLINLDYFAYMKEKYNMRLDIYAWDAGNLDGAECTYETFDSPKIKAQYPNGYGPIVEAARKIGARLGVWGGADGFGETEESARERIEQMVSLARDYQFALFKFDAVCGPLKPEHDKYFIEMMTRCREYSPDLILLNHRVQMSEEAEQYATTFLWEGVETYVDVHISNSVTAPHHRAYLADRGHTPGLKRLTEDHGVCLSSHLDFFEDELIIQAFSRNLILAPEIYGNPWFLRDDEQPHLARIFNLHRKHRDILVEGMLLPESDYCPKHTISRGSPSKRFVAASNMTWDKKELRLTLNSSIGLEKCQKVTVSLHHPYEMYVGEFSYGETVDIPLDPFRALLVEICDSREADLMLKGCKYEVLHEDEDGTVDLVKLLASSGNISYSNGKEFESIPEFDITPPVPRLLAEGEGFAEIPSDWEKQLECALFVQNHDSLEKRSILRSGETEIPQVKAARNAFFSQEMYTRAGCESAFAFDGREDTFFDNFSKIAFWNHGFRHDGGCLRVDFGDVYEADQILFEYFDTTEPENGYLCTMIDQTVPPRCDYSHDMLKWTDCAIDEVKRICPHTERIIVQHVNNLKDKKGYKKSVTYPINGKIRYFRMPSPIDHVYKISLIKNGKELALKSPKANNLLHYGKKVEYAKELKIRVPSEAVKVPSYLSVCLEGVHGAEGAFAILEVDGQYYGAPDRAPGYGANPWECYAHYSYVQDHHYTYYFPIDSSITDRDITVRIIGTDKEKKDYGVRAFLCSKNVPLNGIVRHI